MLYTVYGHKRNPNKLLTYDGGNHKRSHIRLPAPDKPTAERLAKELMETRDDLVYTTFYKTGEEMLP